MLEKLAAGSVMDRVADFFCAGGRGFDVEIVGDAFATATSAVPPWQNSS